MNVIQFLKTDTNKSEDHSISNSDMKKKKNLTTEYAELHGV